MAATRKEWSECFDNRKNFYSCITVDNNHQIDITYERMLDWENNYIGMSWWVQKICFCNDLSKKAGDMSYARPFDTLIEAKKKAFELTQQRCIVCCDENGMMKRRI